MIAPLLLALSICLPPGAPDPSSLHLITSRSIRVDSAAGRPYYLVSLLYVDSGGHEWAFDWLGYLLAAVDDSPRDPDKTDWWIDPGVMRDDGTAVAHPEQSCQWRRRLTGKDTTELRD